MTDISLTHADIELLLPWYLNSTLDEQERLSVRQPLDTCNECRTNVEILSRMRTAIREPSAVPMVPPPRFEELLESIDSNNRSSATPHQYRNWLVAATLATLALATLLFLSGRDDMGTPPAQFETATSTQQANPMDYVLDISFEPGVSIDTRRSFLASINAQEISVDEATLTSRIIVQLPATSLQELDAYTLELKNRSSVRSVNVIALQLPVRQEQ